MPVRVHCQCGQKLTLPEQKAGLRVQCPVCHEYLTIPDAPPAGATELVAVATTRVQAEIVAAISGERKTSSESKAKTPPAKASSKPKAAEKKAASASKNSAKERPLSPPPAGAPVAASLRPEPRAAAPRAAPQPPPRKSKPAPPSTAKPSAAAPSPPPRPVAAKPSAAPPPLPAAQQAAPIAPPSPAVVSAPVIAPAKALAEKVAPPAIQVKPPPVEQPTKKTTPESPKKTPPPAAAVDAKKPRGVEHDPAKRMTVYQLGFGLFALAIASTYPAIMEIVRHVRDPLSPGIENWAYLVLVLCGVQLAYAIYLVQLPDWSSVWMTMIVTATIAVFYAIGMGMSLMAPPENEVIAILGLTQLHAGGYLSLWCFLLTMLTALLSYSMVRTSLKWHKMFELAMAHGAE